MLAGGEDDAQRNAHRHSKKLRLLTSLVPLELTEQVWRQERGRTWQSLSLALGGEPAGRIRAMVTIGVVDQTFVPAAAKRQQHYGVGWPSVGCAGAMFSIGLTHFEGVALPKDPTAAATWFSKATDYYRKSTGQRDDFGSV